MIDGAALCAYCGCEYDPAETKGVRLCIACLRRDQREQRNGRALAREQRRSAAI